MTRTPPIRYLAVVIEASRQAQHGKPATLILASASPRRREILTTAGVDFDALPAEIEEASRPGESPPDLAERLAREKALAVAGRLPDVPVRPVLGSDTIVVCRDAVLGKPRDAAHAVELLGRLMGRTHQVMTGIAVCWTDAGSAPSDVLSQVVVSEVEMRAASMAELEAYVALGESLDKAGGYALQGEGRRFVVEVRGSRSNVIGLPLEETLALLERAGYALAEAVR